MSTDPEAARAQELRQLAQALQAQLVFHAQCGISTYPFVPPAPKQARPAAPAAPLSRPATVRPAAGAVQYRTPARPAKAATLPQADADALARAQEAMRNCHACSLSSSVRLCGQGRAGAICMVVGDFARLPEAQAEPAYCFGPEEDTLLWLMLGAISLKPEQVYVTNALKCWPDSPCQPGPAALHPCRAHLLAEIAAVSPRLICVMGDLAAQILLRTGAPLTRLRTRLQYLKAEGPVRTAVPVMATWHPRLLLTTPDLKRSAWLDLQAMQTQLQGAQTALRNL